MSPPAPAPPIRGVLHVFVAFDWGDEIDLDRARQLVPSEERSLPRRRRTPSSFAYRPAPLRIDLGETTVQVDGLGEVPAAIGATVFDFAAVSLSLRIPFALPADALLRFAGTLAVSAPYVRRARDVLKPLHDRLLPAIHDPLWQDDVSEEYFVFQIAPEHLTAARDQAWLAGMVRLEPAPMSPEEVAEALKHRLSYSPDDLFVPDWTAAVLVDTDCDETLQAVEFANLQLLEFRHIDTRLDVALTNATRTLRPLTRSVLPFWRIFGRPLRVIGELRVEANDLVERTGNVLKLVGDPYLARVYRLAAARFHLETWEQSIQRKLDVLEGVYGIVSDQSSGLRMEFLEATIVLLIVFEIVLAFIRH